MIDLLASTNEIHAKIRAVSLPYPCALMKHQGRLMAITRADIVHPSEVEKRWGIEGQALHQVGTTFQEADELFLVARDGVIRLTSWHYE